MCADKEERAVNYKRTFTIRKKDIERFYILLALDKWGKLAVLMGLAGALTVQLYAPVLRLPDSVILRVLASVAGAVLVTGAIVLYLVIYSRSKVLERLRRNGTESYEQEIEINGFGLYVQAHGKQSKVGFDKLLKVRETSAAFYIYMTQIQAWIFPKDQMENGEEEFRQLRTIFSTVMESKRLKLKK